jgi:hypothetical protein
MHILSNILRVQEYYQGNKKTITISVMNIWLHLIQVNYYRGKALFICKDSNVCRKNKKNIIG